MSDTSSGSKEDENGKARCRDDKAACISGGGGEYAMKCTLAHTLNALHFLGEIGSGSQAKGVKKSYPTRQRAAVMSDTSSGSKEDENGKARCRDDKAACISGGGGEYAMKCTLAHTLNALHFLGEIGPGSQAKGVKKSYPTRQRAAVMSDTSSGSKEDENGKARCRDDKAACISGRGGEYAMKCSHTHTLNALHFLGEIAPGSQAKGVKKSYPIRQRAAFTSNTSSGSKEDENGKASCGDDNCSGVGRGGYAVKCPHAHTSCKFSIFVGELGEGPLKE